MRLRITRTADRELDSLLRWGVRNFGVAVASEYYNGMIQLFSLLCTNPQIAREIRSGIRAHPYRSHIIIYRQSDDRLEILDIRHGRSNWRKHL